jgi:hypothetical protein
MRGSLAGTYIDYDYWMLELTTIRDAEGDHPLPYLPVSAGNGLVFGFIARLLFLLIKSGHNGNSLGH